MKRVLLVIRFKLVTVASIAANAKGSQEEEGEGRLWAGKGEYKLRRIHRLISLARSLSLDYLFLSLKI